MIFTAWSGPYFSSHKFCENHAKKHGVFKVFPQAFFQIKIFQTYGPGDLFQLHCIIYKMNIAYIQKIQIMQNK